MALKVGDKAPDFKLLNQDEETVALSDYKGSNVVVLFFPAANTGVCTKEMCTFRDDLKIFEKLNAKVLGISVDMHFSLKMFQEKNNYNFPLLSDFNRKVINDYDVVLDVFAPGKFDYQKVAKRAAFVVDGNGILKYVEVLASPGDEPNYEAIKKALA
ncbi:MAG TPA: redoxin domain-containing protein [Ignavibacteriaceae bacterium]|jgi:peroxiredoxin|nr:MAG: peroxiredoxin [Ignavibacteriales bacterium UTCHB2]HQF42325.1 redoxin domain-containing protein [Ignavibacteriaceae bacterium]HQI41716.1 redoxin domain-containing protein [Ignavibacteriaceae bacterium]